MRFDKIRWNYDKKTFVDLVRANFFFRIAEKNMIPFRTICTKLYGRRKTFMVTLIFSRDAHKENSSIPVPTRVYKDVPVFATVLDIVRSSDYIRTVLIVR